MGCEFTEHIDVRVIVNSSESNAISHQDALDAIETHKTRIMKDTLADSLTAITAGTDEAHHLVEFSNLEYDIIGFAWQGVQFDVYVERVKK
jgi:hypothetical protein